MMSALDDKQEARERAEQAFESASRLRLAADHLATAAALMSAVVWEMIENDRQRGFGLTIACGRDRVRHEAREVRRWATDELAEANRQAETAHPLEVRP